MDPAFTAAKAKWACQRAGGSEKSCHAKALDVERKELAKKHAREKAALAKKSRK